MPAHYARVALESHHTSTASLITNVLHVEVDALTSPVDWNSVAADMRTWLSTDYNNMLSTADTFDQIVVTDEDYPGSSLGQGVATVNTVGTRTLIDTKLDAALCALTSWKTATAKRYARGHSFWPPAWSSEAMATGGTWDGTHSYWQMCAAFTNKYRAGTTAGSTSYTPIVYSRHQVKIGATPYVFPITAGQLKPQQRFLRSRETTP